MRTIRTSLSLILVLLLLLGMATVASASNCTVVYKGNAEGFVFDSNGDDAPANLFSNFGNMIPGDTVTQPIVIKNALEKNVKVKFYLRSLGSEKDSAALLSQLKMTVQAEESPLYAGPAGDTGTLTDWVYLGTVYSGGEVSLNVTLEVPVTMDNTFQAKTGSITWEIRAEELPVDPSDPSIPQTGDESQLFLYCLLMLLSFLSIFFLLVLKRRNSNCS